MAETTSKPYTVIALRHGGTHLIQPIVRRLTGKTVYIPKGDDAIRCTPSSKVVVFLRDPRNIVVSMVRYKTGITEPGKGDRRIAKLLTRRKPGQETPITHMTAWAERWTKHPGALVVRFENLTTPVLTTAEITRIRDFVGCGDVADAQEYAMGTSVTYTGNHSRWRQWFGPLSDEAWAAGGGAHLVKLMGYK